MKITVKSQWMPISIKPAYVGWYEFVGYQYETGDLVYWNGSQWGKWLDEGRALWIEFNELRADRWRGKLDR